MRVVNCNVLVGYNWGCSSVVERMLCMYEAPGSIPGISTCFEVVQSDGIWFGNRYKSQMQNKSLSPQTCDRSWIQAAEMGFLRRVAGVSLWNKVRSSVIREGLGLEPPLLHVERSQLRWFRHLPSKDATWAPPLGGVPGASSWEETEG